MRRAMIGTIGALIAWSAVPTAGQPERDDIITRSDPNEWRVLKTVTLGGDLAAVHCPDSLEPEAVTPIDMARNVLLQGDTGIGAITVEEATVYFPLANRSASYAVDWESVSARFLANGWEIPLRPTLYRADASGQPIHSGGAYSIWSFGPDVRLTSGIIMQFEFDATSWNVTLNEDAARSITWPTGEWPDDAASSLEPMLFVDRGFVDDYDRAAIERLVEEWTAGSPQSQPPLVLAKWIAGQLSNSFQPVGQIGASDSIPGNAVQPGRAIGAIQGFNATRLDRAAESMQGSPLDLALLLTALYREAGLPARVVVGYVAGDAGGRRDPVRRRDEPEQGVYAWVEFALYDETRASLDDALTWVPVDIIAMRANNVGRRPLEQNWDGFGRSDYFNQLIPLGYHLHPHRLPAVSYGVGTSFDGLGRMVHGVAARRPVPSLWGWNVVPVTPRRMYQTISFSATTPSRTADDSQSERTGPGR